MAEFEAKKRGVHFTPPHKEKSRKVDSVTSDEELIRLQIFDGDIPLGQAGSELLKLALAQHHADRQVRRDLEHALVNIDQSIRLGMTPWPVRWWRWLRRERAG